MKCIEILIEHVRSTSFILNYKTLKMIEKYSGKAGGRTS